MTTYAEGCAILHPNAGIDVRSVAPHERGAKVNYLFTNYRMGITNAWTDAEIEATWKRLAVPDGMRCIKVKVMEA